MSGRVLNSRRARLAALVEPGQKVLEVGIGTGLTIPLYAEDVEITGVDISPRMLDLAIARAAKVGRTADLRVMDAQALEFPTASFDAVLFTLCLCTIPNPALAIAEGLRVCRPGGRLGFLEHVRSNIGPVALLQEVISPVLAWAQHDFWNRRTGELVRAAGAMDLVEERCMLGIFILLTGRRPLIDS